MRNQPKAHRISIAELIDDNQIDVQRGPPRFPTGGSIVMLMTTVASSRGRIGISAMMAMMSSPADAIVIVVRITCRDVRTRGLTGCAECNFVGSCRRFVIFGQITSVVIVRPSRRFGWPRSGFSAYWRWL
jgi:hypothetical protein